jgi:two-component sensor histidine kinase
MLQMQVFDEENQEVINKLNNSMLRVETMASIHQLLYESSSFSRLEFSKIISKLIKATHRSFSAGKDIDIEIETEPFELNINQAVPCSLIINEAITNVYKHAFKNRKKGWIKASLHREGDLVTFELEDDGNGLPDDFDINDLSSLGTKIITALVKQLEGEFELKPGNHGGTIFRLTFAAKNGEDSEESSDT